jgi:hypothetical protein
MHGAFPAISGASSVKNLHPPRAGREKGSARVRVGKVRKYIKYVQRSRAGPLGRFQVWFGVDLADTNSGAQGERLFSRAPDRVSPIFTAEQNRRPTLTH